MSSRSAQISFSRKGVSVIVIAAIAGPVLAAILDPAHAEEHQNQLETVAFAAQIAASTASHQGATWEGGAFEVIVDNQITGEACMGFFGVKERPVWTSLAAGTLPRPVPASVRASAVLQTPESLGDILQIMLI